MLLHWPSPLSTFVLISVVISLAGGVALAGTLGEPPEVPKWLSYGLMLSLLAWVALIYLGWRNRRLCRALRASQLAERDMRASEERHRLLADNATDVIWTIDLMGNLTYISPSVERLRGFCPEEAMQQSLEQSMNADSARQLRHYLQRFQTALQQDEGIEDFRGELALTRRDGSHVWTEATVSQMRSHHGVFIGLIGVSRDVTARREAEARIYHMARHDGLTDLPNRALYSDRLRQALAYATRHQTRLAVLFLDLDRFKPINDTFGHDVGDLLLKAVASRLRACLRAEDTLARVGGDEFLVLLSPVLDRQGALDVAAKLHDVLTEPFDVAGQRLEISSSIGVALFPEHGRTERELYKHADQAMYNAKKRGRSEVRMYQDLPA
ncbi:diguanylate cyclase domain-containing protein [Stutzerimonas tarimensis]|uniref:Diguanylate cyclase domain-containing protein n=1 Tax=Stutzerimonas tarimensis TaxID=1507735 RepID=A0ABV7TAE8_9GAMM